MDRLGFVPPFINMFKARIYKSLFKEIWKANIVKFLDWIFSLNMSLLILSKINCITLKIRSKEDFKSKSQNIWQQIILCSRTVMQRICVWPKIWTLSGRLSLMRTVQLMKKNIYTKKMYISCVPHKNNCNNKNWFTRHETERFPNNHRQECVRAYIRIHDWSFLHEVMIGNHRNKTTES